LDIKMSMGLSCEDKFCTISSISLLSKTVDASDGELSDAREQPNIRCTFVSSLACCTSRSELQIGLNIYKSSRDIY